MKQQSKATTIQLILFNDLQKLKVNVNCILKIDF